MRLMIGFLFLFLMIGLVSAEFELIDKDIETIYAPNEVFNGWIDIDLTDVSSNALLTAFDRSITLKDFLDANGFIEIEDYDCSGNCSNSNITGIELSLDLEFGNFRVPSEVGDVEFELKLGGEVVFKENIEVIEAPVILGIIPLKTSASVPTIFRVVIEGISNESEINYAWDFGEDSLSEEFTEVSGILYTYFEVGIYNLTFTLELEEIEVSRIFSINVTNPKDEIPNTIKRYNQSIKTLNKDLSKLPTWIRDKVKIDLGIVGIEDEIDGLAKAYDNASTDENYIEIMEDLLLLEFPKSVSPFTSIFPSPFFPDPLQIDLDSLEALGAGSYDDRDYESAITNWLLNNVGGSIESTVYKVDYGDFSENLFSHVKITLRPKIVGNKVYFVINEDSSLNWTFLVS